MAGFDIIGDIALLPLFTRNAENIAKKLMSEHKNIKSVYIKSEKVKGRLRKQKLEFLAGEKIKETIHKESGCLMKLNIEDTYFSPRLSYDRMSIAKQVKKGEKVLVMFSGIGPYAIVIAKHSKAKEIYAVEINRKASEYAEENVELNRLNNVRIIQGDVKKVVPKLKIKFDRIIMARPQLKETFLDYAFKVSKKGTIIHFHDFLWQEEIPERISYYKKTYKNKLRLLSWKKSGDISPRKFRIRIDFKVL